jgi:hypothetical protein
VHNLVQNAVKAPHVARSQHFNPEIASNGKIGAPNKHLSVGVAPTSTSSKVLIGANVIVEEKDPICGRAVKSRVPSVASAAIFSVVDNVDRAASQMLKLIAIGALGELSWTALTCESNGLSTTIQNFSYA